MLLVDAVVCAFDVLWLGRPAVVVGAVSVVRLLCCCYCLTNTMLFGNLSLLLVLFGESCW